jgi:hypothetical protein
VGSGQVHRHNGGGRVRYSIEPPEQQTSASVSKSAELVPAAPAEEQVQLAQQVLGAFIGRGLSFGTALTPQEIARRLSETDEGSSMTIDEVKAAANYLWSLGFLTRIEAQGRLKLQLADRSIMTGLKAEKGRADIQERIAKGLSFAPPARLRKRPPAKKKR